MSQRKPGKVLFQGIESGMKLFKWAVLVLVILFWLSGIQNVQPTNVGLLTRFGKLVPASVQTPAREPGLVLALPYPIDQLRQIPKGKEQSVEVQEVWAALDLQVKNNKIDPIYEGYCLTGDHNIVQTKVMVKYVITDPVAYEFGIVDAKQMVHDMTVASLTETIAGWTVDEVLQLQRRMDRDEAPSDANAANGAAPDGTAAPAVAAESQQTQPVGLGETLGGSGSVLNLKPVEATSTVSTLGSTTAPASKSTITTKPLMTEKLNTAVARRVQHRLDAIESGIKINGIEFVAMHYPRHVNKYFENVQTTRIANETNRQRAEEFAGKARFESESAKNTQIESARAQAHQLLSEAQAEQKEFIPLYQEFKQAPELVWQRMYTEAMEQVWKTVGRQDFVPANSRVILTDEQEVQQ